MIWEQLDPSLIMINTMAGNQNEILREMSDRFIERGYCKPTFTEALIQREGLYPTGIQLERIGVAIPHADSEHVLKEAVGFSILDKSVDFHEMGGDKDGETLGVSLVIMLATMGRDHIDLLQCIVALLQNDSVLDQILNASQEKDIIQIIKKWEEE